MRSAQSFHRKTPPLARLNECSGEGLIDFEQNQVFEAKSQLVTPFMSQFSFAGSLFDDWTKSYHSTRIFFSQTNAFAQCTTV
jgi:long-subunit fatty acid transport protein